MSDGLNAITDKVEDELRRIPLEVLIKREQKREEAAKARNRVDEMVSRNLARLRGKKSQPELARVLGIGSQAYFRLEHGTPLKLDQYFKLAEYYGLTLDELYKELMREEVQTEETYGNVQSETLSELFKMHFGKFLQDAGFMITFGDDETTVTFTDTTIGTQIGPIGIAEVSIILDEAIGPAAKEVHKAIQTVAYRALAPYIYQFK